MSFEGGREKQGQNPSHEPPAEVLRATRFTRIESPDEEEPMINFYARDGEPPIYSMPWSPDASTKYYPTIKERPPFTQDELAEAKKSLVDLAEASASLSSADAAEFRSRIERATTPEEINDLEDEIESAIARTAPQAPPPQDEERDAKPKVQSSGLNKQRRSSREDKHEPKLGESDRGSRGSGNGDQPESPPIDPEFAARLAEGDRNVQRVKERFEARNRWKKGITIVPSEVPGRRTVMGMLHKEAINDLGAPAIQTIKANPNMLRLFGELAEMREHGSLVKKIEAGERLTQKEEATLQDLRFEFKHRLDLVAEALRKMTKEDLALMRHNNPDFASLSNQMESGRAEELTRAHVQVMFMRESNRRLNDVVYAIRGVANLRAHPEYAKLHRELEAVQERYKGRSEHFDRFIQYRFTRETPHAYFNKLPFLRHVGLLERLRPGFRERRKQELVWALEKNMEAISAVLGASVSSDETLRSAVLREVREGKRVPEIGKMVPMTEAAARLESERTAKAFTLDALIEKLETFKEHATYEGRSYEQLTPAEREVVFTDAMKTEAHQKLPSGWFRPIMCAIIDDIIEKTVPIMRHRFDA